MSPMTFSMWREWVRSLPWSLRWFVVLVLLRPLLDVFYFLKEISPLLSPLYIVGVLTPVLIFASFTRHRIERFSTVDGLLLTWSALLLLNSLMALSLEVSYPAFEAALKLMTPVLIFFFLRVFVVSKTALIGLLTTFLYSSVFPLSMLLYETVIGPISDVVVTRGFQRHEGLYADVMSYATYVIGALLIACYFYVDETIREQFLRKAMRLFIVAAVCVVGLMSMHHTTSWIVAAAVLGLLGFHGVGMRHSVPLLFVLVVGVAGYFVVGQSVSDRLSSAFSTDIAVIEGQKDSDRAFHGRMSRWRRYAERWDETSVIAKSIGVATAAREFPSGFLLSGVHNDFLRIGFASGVVGLLLYLLTHVVILLQSFSFSIGDRFLIRAASIALLLYSVTTTPTLYAPLLYLLFAILAYGSQRELAVRRRPQPFYWRHRAHESHRDGEPAVTV